VGESVGTAHLGAVGDAAIVIHAARIERCQRVVVAGAAELGLMPAQRTAAEAIFGRMQQAAKALGEEIVQHEQQLGKAFLDRSVDADSMNQHVAHIATLQGKLRAVHLQAHLELTAQLDHTQITKYNELRGYDVAAMPSHHHGAM